MATFFVKNISSSNVTVFSNVIEPQKRLDLLTVTTAAAIISSMKNGELYELLMGRMLAVVNIPNFYDLGATTADIDQFSYCGFMQGHLTEDDLKYPFKFDDDGYLFTDISANVPFIFNEDGYLYVDIGDADVTVDVDIRGDRPVPTDRDSALAMGTEDGYVSGTVHVIKVATDGAVQIGDNSGSITVDQATAANLNAQVFGNTADGNTYSGNAIRVAGADASNKIRTLMTDNIGALYVHDGYGSLTVDQATAANLNAQVQGPTAVGAAPSANPLDLGAITQLADPTSSADGLIRRLRLDDLYCLFTRSKAYDSGTGSDKIFDIAPVNATYANIDFSQTTAVAGGSTYTYYVDMAGYGYLSIQYANLVGSYTKTLKVYTSNRDDGTAPGSLAAGDWFDVTLQWFGSASYTAADFLEKDTPTTTKWVRIDVAVGAGATTDNTWNIWFRKKAL